MSKNFRLVPLMKAFCSSPSAFYSMSAGIVRIPTGIGIKATETGQISPGIYQITAGIEKNPAAIFPKSARINLIPIANYSITAGIK